MRFFSDIVEIMISKLPAIFGALSEVTDLGLPSATGSDMQVLAAEIPAPNPVFFQGMVIMLLVSCIILVCMKMASIDQAYARS